ncbi:metallo-beta-lactamase family protein [Alcanivorax hongdengensis A-11-3]|uniref:Metallo-beta-lactamase family protein n=1 Tax=Alcanivorax hongdengensis A-11-3 TaxID=1177179 RepID=L0WAM6_9GAMM|nr:MBL fold metallo-hydrolase [Alcanivorax hongdengensis]EKF74011.1 metallo-beta-lactamase family protein [Alcanivorax hongdengensis A-11-3]
MRLASLGSGSKGNATLVQADDTLALIDCGFTVKETEQRLGRLGLSGADISAILITHEHGDHVRGAGALARKFGCPLYSSFGTAAAVRGRRAHFDGADWREVRPGRAFTVQALEVLPVMVPHDAREPCQYRFSWQGRVTGVLTDLGSVTPHVVQAYGDCDALVLECNHDRDLLAQGPYPLSLKRRVGGMLGHLSNEQAATLLAQANVDRLQHLVLSHLSEQNNTVDHARGAVEQVMTCGRERIRVASQGEGFDWLHVH